MGTIQCYGCGQMLPLHLGTELSPDFVITPFSRDSHPKK